jgi:transcriptional regulator with XRE-family HTH domain
MPNHSTTSVADFLKTIAANLELQMKGRSMTEEALARASGVSRRTVGNFLRPLTRKASNGAPTRSLPSGTLANFFKLAAALNVEPWELMCDPDWLRFHRTVEQAHVERMRANIQHSR